MKSMKRLITAAAATYALVLTVESSSKIAVPTSSTQALNSAVCSSSSKLSPQAQAKFNSSPRELEENQFLLFCSNYRGRYTHNFLRAKSSEVVTDAFSFKRL